MVILTENKFSRRHGRNTRPKIRAIGGLSSSPPRTQRLRLDNSAYSQTFTYDSLNQLTSSTLGGAASQSWTLDSQGNQTSVTTNGVTQTETANAQNQITSISGGVTPTYDANGNAVSMGLTTQPAGRAATLVYDAWNRLVAVKNASGQVIAQYTYNAMGYRISETYPQGGTGIAAGTVNYIYYDNNWQAIETRTNGTASSDVTSQTVWSASYINAAVLQDTYSSGVIQPDSRLYFEYDANWDTTAVVGYNSTTSTWGVVQRYTYSPYGTITILNADWSTTPTGTTPMVNNLYQGMPLDSVTGLYYARMRNYSPSLGVWTSQDPLQYINGANVYQFVMDNPVNKVDPKGLGTPHGGLSQQQWNQVHPPGAPWQSPMPGIYKAISKDEQALLNFWQGVNNFGRQSPIGISLSTDGPANVSISYGAGNGMAVNATVPVGPINSATSTLSLSNMNVSSSYATNTPGGTLSIDNTEDISITAPIPYTPLSGSVSVNIPTLSNDLNAAANAAANAEVSAITNEVNEGPDYNLGNPFP